MNLGGFRVRALQDFTAGIFLVGLAAAIYWQSFDLTLGSMKQLGPGMMPRVLTVAIGVCGVALVVLSLLRDGPELERWSLRGPLFVFVAVALFGLTVRPFGLAVAGPLVVVIGGLASRETRLIESAIFGVGMTAFCLLLFKFFLTLPIPVAPWLLGY